MDRGAEDGPAKDSEQNPQDEGSSGPAIPQRLVDQILPERKPSASAVGIAKAFCLHYTS